MTKSGAPSLLLKKNPSANFFSLFSIYWYSSTTFLAIGDWWGWARVSAEYAFFGDTSHKPVSSAHVYAVLVW